MQDVRAARAARREQHVDDADFVETSVTTAAAAGASNDPTDTDPDIARVEAHMAEHLASVGYSVFSLTVNYFALCSCDRSSVSLLASSRRATALTWRKR